MLLQMVGVFAPHAIQGCCSPPAMGKRESAIESFPSSSLSFSTILIILQMVWYINPQPKNTRKDHHCTLWQQISKEVDDGA
jgi:hypothetical protein